LKRQANYEETAIRQISKDFDDIFNVISSLQKTHSKAELDLDNIESVFAALEMGVLINKLPGAGTNSLLQTR